MIELRKLAALEVSLLGPKLVVGEYACGVLLSAALGLFVLMRGHTLWQTLIGIYFICLGINYLPLLLYAVALGDPRSARQEIADELSATRETLARYRAQSLLLLVPLFTAILGICQWRRAPR